MLWQIDKTNENRLFNVGTGQARSFAELAEALFSALGKEPKIKYIDMPECVREHYQYFTQADITKLRLAGFRAPFTTLEDGIADYVQTFLLQQDPYR